MNNFTEGKANVFSKANTILPLETESDLLLKKMKRIQKKKKKDDVKKPTPKHNYKNIDKLENIYDKGEPKKETTEKPGFFNNIQSFLNNLDDIQNDLDKLNVEGFDDDLEGFDNNTIYVDEYEDQNSALNFDAKYTRRGTNAGRPARDRPTRGRPSRGSTKRGGSAQAANARSSDKKIEDFFTSVWMDLKRLIADPGDFIYSKIFYKISKPLYNMISRNEKKNNKDVIVITDQIIFFIYSLIAVFISGNWYYLMFYDDGTGIPNSHKFNQLLDTITDTGGLIFKYFRIGSQLQPVWLINLYFCKIVKHIIVLTYGWIESLSSSVFQTILPSEVYYELSQTIKTVVENHKFLFIVFTIHMIRWVNKYSNEVYQNYRIYNLFKSDAKSYEKYADQNIDTDKPPKMKINKAKLPKSKFYNFLVLAIILNICIGVRGLAIGFMTAIGIQPNVIETISRGIQFIEDLPYWMMLGPITQIILFVLAIILNITVLIRIGGLICIWYLYIYSYMGARLRGGSTALDNFFNEIGKPNVCNETNSSGDKIMKIISFIYENLTLFIVVACAIVAIRVYMKTIQNQSAAAMLVSLNIVIIVIAVVVVSYNTFKTKTNLQDYNYIEPYNL